MPTGAITGGIGAIGSIVGGIISANAASNAGNTYNRVGQAAGQSMFNNTASSVNPIYAATGAAQQGVGTATTNAQQYMQGGLTSGNNTLSNIFGQQTANLNPYLATGATAANAMSNAISAGGSLAGSYSLPTAADVMNTPGYQFQLQQGTQAAKQAAAASGQLQSGGTMKALDQYSQGLASTYYQNAVSNSLNAYQTNFSNTLNSLNAAGNMGLQGSSMYNQAAQNYGNNTNSNYMNAAQYMGNTGMQGAQLQGQFGLQGNTSAGQLNLQGSQDANNYYMQGAGGQAAGIMGQGNAYAGMVGGIANGLGTMLGPTGFNVGAKP